MAALKTADIRNMSVEERNQKLKELRDELMHERGVSAMGGAPSSPGAIRALRLNIAEICPVCGLPKELCMCEEIAREQQTVRISIDSRRYGKTVTVIDGIDENDIDIGDLAKQLKNKCAAGGTCKDGRIELQGDHKKRVKTVLEEMGFRTEVR